MSRAPGVVMHEDGRRTGGRDLDALMRLAHRQWFADGVPELCTGTLFLGVGAFLFMRALGGGGALRTVGEVLLLGAIAAYALSMRRLTMAFKARYTLRRRGDVLRRGLPAMGRALSPVTGLILAAAVVWGSATLSGRPDAPAVAWLPLFEGLLIGVAYYYLGHRLRVGRFLAIGALSAVWGALAGVSPWAEPHGSALYLAATGGTLAASGLAALCAYLRRTQPADADAQPRADEGDGGA